MDLTIYNYMKLLIYFEITAVFVAFPLGYSIAPLEQNHWIC